MLFDEKTKGIAQAYLSMLEERNKLNESHFKVGDKVKCIASGMMGTVTKLDTPEEGKYYTVKKESGKMMKYAPDELKKVSEMKEEKIPKGHHKMPDGTIMKDSDHKKEVKESNTMKIANDIEAYAKKSGGVDKNDMMKVAFMLKKGDMRGAKKYALTLDTDPKEWLMTKMGLMESKLDPVNPAELKGSHKDRKDKDINNDGKVDSSDEFLHKRRQAIAKASKNEAIEIELSKKGKLNSEEEDDDDDAVANGNDKMKVKFKKGSDDEKGMKEASCGKVKVKEAMEKKSSLPFEPTSTKKPARNSDGTPQSPMSRARNLAQQGMKKQMAKEGVEQVDEISKSTLGSYVKKAAHDAVIQRKIGADFENLANKARKPAMKSSAEKLGKDYTAKSRKRRAGINTAVDRLTKEGVEQVDELIKKTFENYTWDWDAILDAPEEEIDALIEELNDTDYESFVSEFETLDEGENWYQGSTNSKQPMTADGKETLEARAEADKAFVDAHRKSVKVTDYPGKDKPVTNAKPQSPTRPGEKRNPEPMKTLSDIRRK